MQRPEYSSILERYRRSNEIIVLTGIRRSGKSTLLKQEMESLAESRDKKELLYINFEDPRLSEDADPHTLDLLIETYREAINPDGENIMLPDVVQSHIIQVLSMVCECINDPIRLFGETQIIADDPQLH